MIPLQLRKVFEEFAAGLLVAAFCLLSQAAPAAADLDETARWGGPPLPVPANNEGKFGMIGDLAVGPGGNVGVYDPVLGRAQLFSSDGDLIIGIDGPSPASGEDSVSLDLASDGTVEVFDRQAAILHRFESDGDSIGQIDFPGIAGPVRDFSLDPSGGYLAAYGNQLRVSRFDVAGSEVADWPTGRLLTGSSPGGAFLELNEHTIDDQVFVASGNLLGMFSRGGESWANWSLATEECGLTGPGIIDLALDSGGNIYLLASVSPSENRTTLFKLDETLNEVWREAVDPNYTKVGVGPDGSIYLAGSDLVIARFTRTEPAEPIGRWQCQKPPIETKEFKLLGVKYGPARAWARVRVEAPEAGTITVTGPKIIRRERTVQAGIHVLTVKARKKFTRPARPRRKLSLKVEVTFSGPTVTDSKSTRVNLKGKLRKGRRHG